MFIVAITSEMICFVDRQHCGIFLKYIFSHFAFVSLFKLNSVSSKFLIYLTRVKTRVSLLVDFVPLQYHYTSDSVRYSSALLHRRLQSQSSSLFTERAASDLYPSAEPGPKKALHVFLNISTR